VNGVCQWMVMMMIVKKVRLISSDSQRLTEIVFVVISTLNFVQYMRKKIKFAGLVACEGLGGSVCETLFANAALGLGQHRSRICTYRYACITVGWFVFLFVLDTKLKKVKRGII